MNVLMNGNTISGNTLKRTPAQGKDTEISALQKRAEGLQEQMQKLSENDTLSPKEIADKKRELQTQLDEINRQLNEKLAESEQGERLAGAGNSNSQETRRKFESK